MVAKRGRGLRVEMSTETNSWTLPPALQLFQLGIAIPR